MGGPSIKFCGITRAVDAEAAVREGASHVGMIFAGGPRHLTIERARLVAEAVPDGIDRVGVFPDADPRVLAEAGTVLGLTVVQLHGDASPDEIRRARDATGAAVWAALRIRGDEIPPGADALFEAADAVVLDAHVPHSLGGTGVTLPWAHLAAWLRRVRAGSRARVVLAGGLRPENVAEAVALLAPDVVDVSSGVESAPGIKDHARMHAFAAAARGRSSR